MNCPRFPPNKKTTGLPAASQQGMANAATFSIFVPAFRLEICQNWHSPIPNGKIVGYRGAWEPLIANKCIYIYTAYIIRPIPIILNTPIEWWSQIYANPLLNHGFWGVFNIKGQGCHYIVGYSWIMYIHARTGHAYFQKIKHSWKDDIPFDFFRGLSKGGWKPEIEGPIMTTPWNSIKWFWKSQILCISSSPAESWEVLCVINPFLDPWIPWLL